MYPLFSIFIRKLDYRYHWHSIQGIKAIQNQVSGTVSFRCGDIIKTSLLFLLTD